MGIESPTHLIFIAIVALIVLGPKRLPDLARSLGHGIREFRQSLEDGANSHDAPPAPAPAPAQTVTPSPEASSATPTPAPPSSPEDSTRG
jgi:TatA/E family protein of Tat protein translocase